MKTWFITGASSGLGLAITRKLLKRGDRVVGAARSRITLERLSQDYPATLDIKTFDIRDTHALRLAVDSAFAGSERIDVVVNSAGYGLFGAAEELTDDQIDRQIATNLLGSIHLIRSVLPHMRDQRGGRIVQVSSEGGQVAYPNFSLYHATKWGIEGFVESVAQEVSSFGIRFILAEPGPTATGFGAALDQAPARDVYDATRSGEVRRAIAIGRFEIKGDADRTANGIIAAADADEPPLRLALGSTAFENIEQALSGRLEALRGQRTAAYAADRV